MTQREFRRLSLFMKRLREDGTNDYYGYVNVFKNQAHKYPLVGSKSMTRYEVVASKALRGDFVLGVHYRHIQNSMFYFVSRKTNLTIHF